VMWVYDMLAAVWGSPLVADGKVYLGDEDGDVVILQAGKEKKVLAEINMGSSVYSTAVPANGTLYIMNRNQLFAISEKAPAPATEKPAEKPAVEKPAEKSGAETKPTKQ
jgi:outer membrane protein assembly factor BamB